MLIFNVAHSGIEVFDFAMANIFQNYFKDSGPEQWMSGKKLVWSLRDHEAYRQNTMFKNAQRVRLAVKDEVVPSSTTRQRKKIRRAPVSHVAIIIADDDGNEDEAATDVSGREWLATYENGTVAEVLEESHSESETTEKKKTRKRKKTKSLTKGKAKAKDNDNDGDVQAEANPFDDGALGVADGVQVQSAQPGDEDGDADGDQMQTETVGPEGGDEAHSDQPADRGTEEDGDRMQVDQRGGEVGGDEDQPDQPGAADGEHTGDDSIDVPSRTSTELSERLVDATIDGNDAVDEGGLIDRGLSPEIQDPSHYTTFGEGKKNKNVSQNTKRQILAHLFLGCDRGNIQTGVYKSEAKHRIFIQSP